MNRHDELIEILKNSELVNEYRHKQSKELINKRQEAITACARLKKEALDINSKMENLMKDFKDNLQRLEDEKKELNHVTGERLAPLREGKNRIDREITENEFYLRTNYDSAIDDAIEFFNGKIDVAAREKPLRNVADKTKKLSGKSEVIIHTTQPAISGFIDYCRSAWKELQEMKVVEAKCDLARIEQLKANLPDIKSVTAKAGWVEDPALLAALLTP